MASSKVVIGTLVTTQEFLDATILSQCAEVLIASTEQLVSISLVSYIPDNSISTKIKHFEKCYCDFYSTKGGSKVSTLLASDFNDALPTVF
jgi:hypothetical protein